MDDIPSWHIVGDWFDNCSCAVPCPCTFAQAPDNGFCESVLFWHVREGHYGDVKLDNLSFVRVGRWEGDLWARKATGVAASISMIVPTTGRWRHCRQSLAAAPAAFPAGSTNASRAAGGAAAPSGPKSRMRFVDIVGKVKAWAKAIIGPTSPPGKYPQLMNAPGSETGPGPQLVTWGKSTILSVDAHGFKFEYTLNSAKHIPFDWVGP